MEKLNKTITTLKPTTPSPVLTPPSLQIGLYLDAENLKFELVERSEIDKDFKKIANLPLVKIIKLIDQLNEGIDKLQEIG